jgi:hypothetical protein
LSVDDGLRALVRKHAPKVHWTTIETGLVQRGVPDLHGCWQGADLWLECKAVKRGWAVKMRPEQTAWHLRRARCGGRSWVLVRRRVAGADELWVVAGWASAALQQRGLPPWACPTPGLPLPPGEREGLPSGALLGAWAGGAAGWPWGQLLALLAGQQGR